MPESLTSLDFAWDMAHAANSAFNDVELYDIDEARLHALDALQIPGVRATPNTYEEIRKRREDAEIEFADLKHMAGWIIGKPDSPFASIGRQKPFIEVSDLEDQTYISLEAARDLIHTNVSAVAVRNAVLRPEATDERLAMPFDALVQAMPKAKRMARTFGALKSENINSLRLAFAMDQQYIIGIRNMSVTRANELEGLVKELDPNLDWQGSMSNIVRLYPAFKSVPTRIMGEILGHRLQYPKTVAEMLAMPMHDLEEFALYSFTEPLKKRTIKLLQSLKQFTEDYFRVQAEIAGD